MGFVVTVDLHTRNGSPDDVLSLAVDTMDRQSCCPEEICEQKLCYY